MVVISGYLPFQIFEVYNLWHSTAVAVIFCIIVTTFCGKRTTHCWSQKRRLQYGVVYLPSWI